MKHAVDVIDREVVGAKLDGIVVEGVHQCTGVASVVQAKRVADFVRRHFENAET